MYIQLIRKAARTIHNRDQLQRIHAIVICHCDMLRM